MEDEQVLANINRLVEEEHALRAKGGGLGPEDEARLTHLEERLDQCWDLLRQRRAKRHSGDDPDEANARPIDTVEHYRQ